LKCTAVGWMSLEPKLQGNTWQPNF
jgi:hypothetical protein